MNSRKRKALRVWDRFVFGGNAHQRRKWDRKAVRDVARACEDIAAMRPHIRRAT